MLLGKFSRLGVLRHRKSLRVWDFEIKEEEDGFWFLSSSALRGCSEDFAGVFGASRHLKMDL